jgi:hypothetical protein
MLTSDPIAVALFLVCGHFYFDFCAQSEWMAKAKRGDDPHTHWAWAMTAHCMTHALSVLLATGVPLLAIAELVVHFAIDTGKARYKLYGMTQDQVYHLACKCYAWWLWLWLCSK